MGAPKAVDVERGPVSELVSFFSPVSPTPLPFSLAMKSPLFSTLDLSREF